ncbi:MAG: transporter [Herbaspirillum sp.]|nr:transporter [Herbaspirillum sp.]
MPNKKLLGTCTTLKNKSNVKMTAALPAIPVSASAAQATAPTSAQSKRVIWAAVIGNGLITYDFTVYGFSAVTIGHLFFSSGSPLTSLLLSLATFGAGFAMRPLGALIIGILADNKGRKAALTFSIALMTLGTGIIACTPSYASIGASATLLLVLARLMQGFAAGGEIGVSTVVLMESAAQGRRCYLVSWRGASQGVAALAGALVGAGITAALTPEAIHHWGWRIPFVLGMLIGPVGLYLRGHMVETGAQARHRPILKPVFAHHSRALWFGILLTAAPAASVYVMVYYMPTYLVTILHLSPVVSLLSACLAGTIIFLGNPLLARIADRQRGRKTLQYITLIGSIVLVYPAFLALTHGVGNTVSLLIIGGYAVAALTNGGAAWVMILEAFPRRYRATGMSMTDSFGATIFGGFAPFIAAWSIGATGNSMAPAWYLLAALCISLFALIRFPDVVEDD